MLCVCVFGGGGGGGGESASAKHGYTETSNCRKAGGAVSKMAKWKFCDSLFAFLDK